MKTLLTILFLVTFLSSQSQNVSQSQVRQFNAVPAYRVFGRGSGVGSPSFIQLDSNHIPLLHSQWYYDGRFQPLGSYLSNITGLVSAGTNVSVTGSGTSASPYVINSTASGGGSGLNATTSIDSSTTHFSSFNAGISASTTLGSIVGNVLNEGFNGTSIPSGWSAGGAPSVTYSNKLIVASGSSDWTKYLQNGYFNYDKEKFSMTIIPQGKSVGDSGIGITFGSNSLNFSTSLRVSYNLSSSVDSGKIRMNYDGTTYVATSPNFSFNTGDTLIASLIREGWALTASIFNKRTGQRVETYIASSSHIGTGGAFRLTFLGGSQHITNVRVDSWNLKNTGIAFVGDSHTAGSGATTEANSFAQLTQKGNKYRYSNFSHPSITADKWIVSDLPNLIVQSPKYAIVTLGYNDRRDLTTDTTTFGTRYRSILSNLISNGITPVAATLVPTASGVGAAIDNFSLSIQNNATSYGVKVADVRTALLKGGTAIYKGYLSSDNVHLNDSGHLVVAQTISQNMPEAYNLYSGDTTSSIVLNNVPTGKSNMNILVHDAQGKVYSVPNTLPSTDGWIINKMWTTAAQGNSGIYTSNIIRSDAGFMGTSSQGLRIGFNNEDATSTTGANIDITNAGVGGIGYPQVWDNITGSGNIKIIASSAGKTKPSIASAISGNNNTLINATAGATLSGNDNLIINSATSGITTGINNTGIGVDALRGITTGSNNTHISSRNSGVVTYPTGLTGTTIIGDMLNQSGTVLANYDVLIGAGNSAFDHTIFFGGKGGANNIYMRMSPAPQISNKVGNIWHFVASSGIGAGESGKVPFEFSTPVASGTTIQSASTTTMQVERLGVALGGTSTLTKANDAILDIQSTTAGFILPRMTTTQRDAIATGTLTLVMNAGGTGYTNGNVALTFTGGAGTGAAGIAVISGGSVQSVVLTSRGTGYTSAPTVTVTSGAGTGATFTATIGATEGVRIYNLTTHQSEEWNGTGWVH